MTALIEAGAPNADAPVTANTITERAAALTATIERERLVRAVAVLDGGDYDDTVLTASEAALEALEDASGELSRRDRAADAERAAIERKALRDSVPPLLVKWLAAIDEQEASARAMVAASAQADQVRTEIERTMKALFVRSEILLSPQVQVDRRSRSLAALLQKHIGTSHYGEMVLHPGMFEAHESWSMPERAMVETIILQLKEDEK